jgi:hypothetical protein
LSWVIGGVTSRRRMVHGMVVERRCSVLAT